MVTRGGDRRWSWRSIAGLLTFGVVLFANQLYADAPKAPEPSDPPKVAAAAAPRASEPDVPPPAPRATEPPAVYDVLVKEQPETIDDLRILQEHVRELSKKLIPVTVGIAVGQAQGSGVIITPDGYVLTAGHVSGEANRDCLLILQDGRTVKGKTLGANNGIDSGMIKITAPNPDGGPWPYAEMGNSKKLTRGQWCIATGHPGGYQRGRPPVVRLGRILSPRPNDLTTDCTLVGGDSGGPLWDLEGRVIGINSRIGPSLSANIHVPVNTFRDTWDRLAKAEVWGGRQFGAPAPGPFVGLSGDRETDPCKITLVLPDSPAAKAGVKVGDVVKTFGGQPVKNFGQLVEMIGKKKIGEKVAIEVTRGKETLKIDLEIGKRPGS